MKNEKIDSILDRVKFLSNNKNLFDTLNNTDSMIGCELLHKLVSDRAKNMPMKTAIVNGRTKITYGELETDSNQVAQYLVQKGAAVGEKVAVMVPREVSSIINILGILKAGCAYVPIDPDYPEERKKYMIDKSECKYLLNEKVYQEEILDKYAKEIPEVQMDLDMLAYTIYTSGSTGKPKGVEISHRAACNTILDIIEKFHVDSNDKIIALSSMCFDLSVFDIFGALFVGATLVQIEDQRDVKQVLQILKDEKITIWNSIPSTMKMLLDNTGKELSDTALRLMLLSGDWIPLKLSDEIYENLPACEVISLGGATEAAIWSIYYPIKEIDKTWNSIPYGTPLANQQIYILNYEYKLCPTGVEGEIAIGGTGVAAGYANDKEKTAAAFMEHPDYGKIYLTGDYGVLNSNGYIEFRGRKDNQVKIRGYRVELGEIEAVLNKIEGIDTAVVTSLKDSFGNTYLCGYYVEKQDSLSLDKIKVTASKKLPPYMIPSRFVKLEKFPLTENGKIDRKNLPQPKENIIKREHTEKYDDKIVNDLLEICNAVFGESVVMNPTDNFFEIGINSISMVSILTQLEEKYGVQIKFKDFLKQNNVLELAELVKESNPDIKNEAEESTEKSIKNNSGTVAVEFDNESISYERMAAITHYIKDSEYLIVKKDSPLTILTGILISLQKAVNLVMVPEKFDEKDMNEIQQSFNAHMLIDKNLIDNIPDEEQKTFEFNPIDTGMIKLLNYDSDKNVDLTSIERKKIAVKRKALVEDYQLTANDCFAVNFHSVNEGNMIGAAACFGLGAKMFCYDKFNKTAFEDKNVTVYICADEENGEKNQDEKAHTHYYWSSIVNWKIINEGVQIGDRFYQQEVYRKLMPELYFISQDGVMYADIIQHFDSIEKEELNKAIGELIDKKVLIDSILDVEDIFSSQDKLFKHSYGNDLLFKEEVYKKFKQEQLSRSLSYNNETTYLGYFEDFPDTFAKRRSSRKFDQELNVPFSTFGAVLNAFRQNQENNIKTYFYASAGGLYPVDVFVYVKKNRVQNLEEGLYYYNPVKNAITLVDRKNRITADAHYFTNKDIFAQSAFSIYFIYNAEVTMPRYSGAGYLYSLIDTGIMVSTFTQACQMMKLGVCSIGDMNFDRIRPFFGLTDHQKYIHCLEVGVKESQERPVEPIMKYQENAETAEESMEIKNLKVVMKGKDSTKHFVNCEVEFI